MNNNVSPPLASFTVSTSFFKPGINRSSPMRSSGPLGISRTPVASTTSTPGRPSANRWYQSRFCCVTKPSSVARHGTIAGTHVRLRAVSRPISIGLNRRERAASSADGQRVSSNLCLIGRGNFHILATAYTILVHLPQEGYFLSDDLLKWRSEFPILNKTVYLISHSLGAMPKATYERLHDFADAWATRGVRAWAEGWWDMPVTVGNEVGRIIGSDPNTVVMHQNVSICQSLILSALPPIPPNSKRNKIVFEELNFP